jgi:small conductance mechanosensitive channel
MEEPLAALEQSRDRFADLALQYGPGVLAAVAILIAGYFAGGWAGRALDRLLGRLELDATVRILLVRIIRVLVLVLFGIMALQNLGIELLPLIAGLGIAGAGIALALQGVLGNLAAGLTIVFTRPFKVGEYISIVDEEGEVDSISLFSTTLRHPDRSHVVIPNRKIVGEILHNYGTIRQLGLSVGVAYDTDIGDAIATVEQVLRANSRVLQDPSPVLRVSALADSSVNIDVKPWVAVADYGAAGGEINRAILEAFRQRGISIPFPQREVRLLGSHQPLNTNH